VVEIISIIVTTIVVFALVDLLLRMLLNKSRETRIRKERAEALDTGLKLDVSEEAPTLKRVELENPKARILAVDDEAIILDSFRKMLVMGGYSIDTVEYGPEALGLIRENDYDFVFTDLKMPGMDGVEVTKSVKHLRPDIDVIVITGYATIETAVETVKVGAMDYVEKPFTEDELLEFVNKALIKRQDRQERETRHTIRLIKPGTSESKSRFELNVPAGAFVSPQHAWAKIELNGIVRVGLDDLIRKIYGRAESIELPLRGRRINRGDTLFTVSYGELKLDIPSPLTGTITLVNDEQEEHPEWLAIKPFTLSWMCGIEPSDLAGELPAMKIGRDAVEWYQEELNRYSRLADELGTEPVTEGQPEDEFPPSNENPDRQKLLSRYSESFLK
jgi:CheY-like chemotaxis protein/glycine cleavage system H lipoate-binding protein